MAQSIAVIPARYASTRLPGKPLLDRTGKPLVVHVAEQAAKAKCVDLVIVATDDARIAKVVQEHGYKAVMTREDHPNGTSRIAEAVGGLPRGYDLVVNVQGDEPEIEPGVIDGLIQRMRSGGEPMATVVAPFADDEDPSDANIVKVVVNARGQALYFSRALIPHKRDIDALEPARLKHLGIYAYRRDFLEQYIHLAPTAAEQAEQLEQLRVLEHGHAIACLRIEKAHPGIDTPADYEAFVCRHGSA